MNKVVYSVSGSGCLGLWVSEACTTDFLELALAERALVVSETPPLVQAKARNPNL